MFKIKRHIQIHFLEPSLVTKLCLSEQLCYLAQRRNTRTQTNAWTYSSVNREACFSLKVQVETINFCGGRKGEQGSSGPVCVYFKEFVSSIDRDKTWPRSNNGKSPPRHHPLSNVLFQVDGRTARVLRSFSVWRKFKHTDKITSRLTGDQSRWTTWVICKTFDFNWKRSYHISDLHNELTVKTKTLLWPL